MLGLGGANDTNLRVIKLLQKRAARIILGAHRFTPSSSLFNVLHWLPFADRVDYHRGVLTYKAINNLAPAYISQKFVLQSSTYNTRSSSIGNVIVPKPKLEAYRKSFVYTGSVLWNSLPVQIRNSLSLHSFKKASYQYLTCRNAN